MRLTEEGLEYEASDHHRQGLELSAESKTVNSAAFRPWARRVREYGGRSEWKKFRRLAATLNSLSLDRSDCTQCSWKRLKVDVRVDLDWAKSPGRRSTCGGTMMINSHSGETLVHKRRVR